MIFFLSQLYLKTRLHLSRKDCNCSEKKIQRNSEKAQEECHTFCKILGTVPTCLGEAEAAEDLLVPRRSSGLCCTAYTLYTQGSFLPLKLSHL